MSAFHKNSSLVKSEIERNESRTLAYRPWRCTVLHDDILLWDHINIAESTDSELNCITSGSIFVQVTLKQRYAFKIQQCRVIASLPELSRFVVLPRFYHVSMNNMGICFASLYFNCLRCYCFPWNKLY